MDVTGGCRGPRQDGLCYGEYSFKVRLAFQWVHGFAGQHTSHNIGEISPVNVFCVTELVVAGPRGEVNAPVVHWSILFLTNHYLH